jgi:hypothetical protein
MEERGEWCAFAPRGDIGRPEIGNNVEPEKLC